MVRVLCYLLVVSLASSLHAAVRAWVDKSDIDETQTITLTVEAQSTARNVEPPDWTVLEDDFRTHSLGENRILNIVNGKVQSKSSFAVQLEPRRIGSMTIPSFDIGGEKTEPITIIVRALDEEIKQQLKENVFIETIIDSRRQYVQAAIHVTRKLYYSNNVLVRQEIPQPTDVDNALVVIVGEVERTYALREERNYNVLLQRFVLFPERSGELIIPPAVVPVRVSLGTRELQLSISSHQEKLEVLPIPDEFPSNHDWFPARDVRISDSLAVADLEQLHAGDTIIREVTISATDAHSTGIPEVEFAVPDEIRQYPTSPTLEDTALISRIVGRRTQSASLLLTEPGKYAVPDVSIYWWNTETDQLVETVIGGRNMVVAPDPLADSGTGEAVANSSHNSGSVLSTTSFPEWWLNVIIGLGWSLALVFGYMYFTQRAKQPKPKVSTTTVDLRLLRVKLASDDPRQVKSGMVEWLAQHLDVSQADALKLLQSNLETRRVLNEVNISRYARESQSFKTDRRKIETALNKIVEYQKNNVDTSSTFLQMYNRLSATPS